MPPDADATARAQLARRIAATGNLPQNLSQCKGEDHSDIDLERLTLPAKQLTYRECYAAAALYEELFRLVHDDRKIGYGSKAVQYLKQYVELASIREKVWARLEAEGIPYRDQPNVPFMLADRQGHGSDVFEYHNGFYCVHLWFAGGHRYTSFLVDRDCNLQYATIHRAAGILADAFSEPGTIEHAVWFLREVLRVLPYDSKVVSSFRDIPPPPTDRLSEENAKREMAEWQTFVAGVGGSIVPPVRTDVLGSEKYTIYVYQKLGGQVLRYTVSFGGGGCPRLQEETLARWIGDYWAIM
jgi:hypothetical protein